MAVKILIDGYNFIGRAGGLRGDVAGRRNRLLRALAAYRRAKGHPVTVVFDGGRSPSGGGHREWLEGVEVIFSGPGESADQVLVEAARELGNSCVIVSSDREVQRAAREAGATAITSGEFEGRLVGALSAPEEPDEPIETFGRKRGNPRRRPKSERRKRQRLGKL